MSRILRLHPHFIMLQKKLFGGGAIKNQHKTHILVPQPDKLTF